MSARLRNWWENLRSSLWFVPAGVALLAVALSLLLPAIDRELSRQALARTDWLFSGDASAARSILSVVAGSLVTVISLVFSITIVVLQQASTQFTPRIIGRFMRHLGNQVVLAAYLGTFLYALLILRQVRGEENPAGEFIPAVSISAAIALSALCVGLLVYFIHHTGSSLQVPTVTRGIHDELMAAVERLYPEEVGSALGDGDDLDSFRARHQSPVATVIASGESGYLRSIDIDAIEQGLTGCDWAIIEPQVGWYIDRGTVLVELGGVGGEPGSPDAGRLRAAFILDRERSMQQDLLFGIRQLADIALKALSPGINDPTTAEYALSALGSVVGELAARPFPRRTRVMEGIEAHDGPVEVWVNRPSFADIVDEAFSQIRRYGKSDAHVTRHLLTVLGSVASRTCEPSRGEPLRQQIEAVVRALEGSSFSSSERAAIHEGARRALAALPSRVAPLCGA